MTCRIAVFQDYLAQMGGAEQVTEAILQALPNADLYTTLAASERLSPYLRGRSPQTTWMQALPAKGRLYRHYFLLYPLGVESARLDKYDLIVSSCCGYAKGVKRGANAVHVCYCHTPMRFIWRFSEYMARERFSGASKLALKLLLKGLKRWETRAAARPDFYIANSKTVAGRLKAAFGVSAAVIEPPISAARFQISREIEDYYLVLSRLVPYKQIDLAVEACTKTGRRLIVIGDGPDRARLQAKAGPTVAFLGRQPDSVVNRHASRAQALIFPGEEDFGLAPLEINAAGRPVVAYGAGGATETIIEGMNGILFDSPTVDSLIQGLEKCESYAWLPDAIRKNAMRYDIGIFQKRLLSFLSGVSPALRESLPVRHAPTQQPEIALG